MKSMAGAMVGQAANSSMLLLSRPFARSTSATNNNSDHIRTCSCFSSSCRTSTSRLPPLLNNARLLASSANSILTGAHKIGSSHLSSVSISNSRRARTRDGSSSSSIKTITAQAKSQGDVESIGPAGVGAIVGGLVANPVVVWSLYALKTTGCGLPPGPGGSLGALEGVSYLVILGIIGWSIYSKVKTGSGLPQGPFGLLGAVEGVSYLSLLAIGVVFGLQALEVGGIPGPLPGDQCFG